MLFERLWQALLRPHRHDRRSAQALDQMNEISLLLCGDKSEGIAKVALDQLSSSIRWFSTKAARFLVDDITDEALSFGPFCARVLLENGCAALVGRLDSFRMLYLSEFQA